MAIIHLYGTLNCVVSTMEFFVLKLTFFLKTLYFSQKLNKLDSYND